ncbi:MAG: PD-(D/E)XK nuclease family protein [Aquabacterium sp.]|nr:PD-(D/E)XK nuclease family protein [Aquabacterium sp.]
MTLIVTSFQGPVDGVLPSPWSWSPQLGAAECWQAWAREVSAWLIAQRADPKDALIILPVGAVLAQARQAWTTAVGGWAPRIDTIAAVASGLSWDWMQPVLAADSGLPLVTLDPVVDRLQAARVLGGEMWGRQWAQRDRRGFEFALDQVVDAAHTWLRRLLAIEPAQRATYAAELRALMAGPDEQDQAPGGRERLLLAWALEWAVATAEAGVASDLLFSLRPSAFVGVTAGTAVSPGTEAHLMLAVLQHMAGQGLPTRWITAQPAMDDVTQPRSRSPVLVPCLDAEDEAQQAAAQVIAAINAGRDALSSEPVALIALDRSLIRRVRALLEGAGVQIADETGWRLSTTRAAAVLSRLIKASHPRASTDDLLDWIKSGWLDWSVDAAHHARPAEVSVDQASSQLELWCRRHSVMGAWGLDAAPDVGSAGALPVTAALLCRWARYVVSPLQSLWQGQQPSLGDWLSALHEALTLAGALSALRLDQAGELALRALYIDGESGVPEAGAAWDGLSAQTHLDGSSFMRWVGAVLEATTFRPPAPDAPHDVVITTMARAVLRPFQAIVLPGTDERQLGAMGRQSGWLSTPLREAMDLATPETLRAAQWDAFCLLMNRPGVICLYRQAKGSEPLEPSAWLERWSAQAGLQIGEVADVRDCMTVAFNGVLPPEPNLLAHAWALPEQLAATGYEALRQCPYRFFASYVLGLREADELDEGLDRSDFGNWLHEALRCFHADRQGKLSISTPDEDVQAWLIAAQRAVHEMGFDRDGQRPYFLPFKADLDKFARAYVGWFRAHEADGWAVQSSEVTLQKTLSVGDGLSVRLYGKLDRVDARHRDGAREQFVLDYKTGSLTGLKAKVAQPDEDTQLAFYAALSDAQWPVSASYLHLEAKAVTQVVHEGVEDSAQALLVGLAHDWQRLQGGAAMPALGEGAACAYCQAKGLCRKDHWSNQEASS